MILNPASAKRQAIASPSRPPSMLPMVNFARFSGVAISSFEMFIAAGILFHAGSVGWFIYYDVAQPRVSSIADVKTLLWKL